eukprot:3080896-Amphidinium_carterae.1
MDADRTTIALEHSCLMDTGLSFVGRSHVDSGFAWPEQENSWPTGVSMMARYLRLVSKALVARARSCSK